MQKHNFSPGPAAMPEVVWQEASESLLNYKGSGLSIAEISHRSPVFQEIIEEATALVKELYGTHDDFEVLWLPGGASAQLAIAPMNLVNTDESVAFVETGFWAKRAIDAAAELCGVEVLASAAATNFDRIPKPQAPLPPSVRYFHVVSNETIEGTQWHQYPDLGVPLVADMTSDFLTRPLPLEKFGLVYASAQKNFGIAGITCVMIRKEMLDRKINRVIPSIFDYKTHIQHQSLYHTCPTFPIYVSLLALRWTKQQGGLVEMERRNQEKAKLIYQEIDENPLFEGIAVAEDRSVMNACFRGISAEIEADFLKYTEQQHIVAIKGYPTVGGFRASMYNAMPLESVQALVQAMRDFAKHSLLTNPIYGQRHSI